MALLLFIIASCLGILLSIFAALIRHYFAVVTVENVSMSPTLEPGDRVLVVRCWPGKWLRRGDIVLVWPSRTSLTGPTLLEVKPYIKRIVGLGEGMLTTSRSDGAETDQLYQNEVDDKKNQQVWYIPQGYIFVRGDNRAGSLDSLAWGPIPLQSVLGVVLMKLPRKAFSFPSPHPLPPDEIPTFGLPEGQTAPPFTAQTLSGQTVTLATYSGQAVVFLFIAPTNRCREIIPVCAALAPKAAEAGVTMVFVSAAGVEPTCLFIDEFDVNLPILVASRANNPFLRDYNISGTPAYCFISEQGKIQSSGFLNMSREGWRVLAESWVGHKAPVLSDLY